MFEQGSSTSTTAPSLRVQTRPCGGPSDLGHAPSQMSPEYAESFSDGPPSSHCNGKGKAFDILPSNLAAKKKEVDYTDDWDDIYMSEEPFGLTTHSAAETNVRWEQISPVFTENDPSRATFMDDHGTSDDELCYPEEDEMARRNSAPLYNPLQVLSSEETSEEEELQYGAGTDSPVRHQQESEEVLRNEYEDDEIAPAVSKTHHADGDASTANLEEQVDEDDELDDDEEEGEEEEQKIVLQYGIRTVPPIRIRDRSESEVFKNEDNETTPTFEPSNLDANVEDEDEDEEEEDEEEEDDEGGGIVLQYGIRTGGFPVRPQIEMFKYEDDDIAPPVFKPYYYQRDTSTTRIKEDDELEEEATHSINGTSIAAPNSPFNIKGLYDNEEKTTEDTSPDPSLAELTIEEGELPDVVSPPPTDFIPEDGEIPEYELKY
ncbi:hypothetical protein CVT25_010839 [Psilocybe cyanescens]|uniref:Uncharacterized protein n=1 Tax=Psilocybe cyanescens TaxID=93625 RepID=A0A409WF62_PSICY|nr:hypothetical protein CVT25_010839 [Psilocybe cyanescens]